MQLGNLKPNGPGVYMGRIATLDMSMTVALRHWEARKANSPRFEILAATALKTWVRVGFLFEHEKKSDGELFLQGSIDSPSMNKPLYIACFMEEDGSYNVTWSRPRRPRNELGAPADSSEGPDAPDDDGLGESTAAGDGMPPVEPASRRGRRADQAQQQQQQQQEAPVA